MKLTITDPSKYLKSCEVKNLPITYEDSKEYELFGNKVVVYDDVWMHHLHLKVTDKCNAACEFCIEQHCAKNENENTFLINLDRTLNAMSEADLLFSVSVTGGEPTLFGRFEDLCSILSKYNIGFLTMNTNGFWVEKYIDYIDGLFDFINISRHSISDERNNEIFHTNVLTKNELKALKSRLKTTKMRIQCVMSEVTTVEEMNEFIDAYSFADDISFRRLMEAGDEFGLDYSLDKDRYNECLEWAFNNWEFKEQTIQDYYVYEIYNTGSTDVTFSYSNMRLLREVEHTESEDFYREFILHPDGTLSGSWLKDNKILISDKTEVCYG